MGFCESNLICPLKDIDKDDMLKKRNVSSRSRLGLRAAHVDNGDLQTYAKLNLCIIKKGNSDISLNSIKNWLKIDSLLKTAAIIYWFTKVMQKIKDSSNWLDGLTNVKYRSNEKLSWKH